MFHRATRVFVSCPQCRPCRSCPPKTPGGNTFRTLGEPTTRRYQSAVAVRVDHDDTNQIAEHDNIGQQDEKANRQSQGLEDNGQVANIHFTDGGSTKFRRWRPHNAEDLGLNVLGKPAEIIILPSRKRKIVRASPEPDSEEAKIDIRKSLESELKPVLQHEVFKNIESLGEELRKGSTEFSEIEWKDHRRRLANGFTRTQLHDYLLKAGNPSPSTKPTQPATSPGLGKRDLAAMIMRSAWNWSCTPDSKPETKHTAQDRPGKQIWETRPAKLGYIMSHEKSLLGELSETLGVQIDIFKSSNAIRISGQADAVLNACTKLNALSKTIKETTVSFAASLWRLLPDKSKSENILSMLMHRHKLYIVKDRDHLRIAGPAGNSDKILRELWLLSDSFQPCARYSFLEEHEQCNVTCVPFFPLSTPDWCGEDQNWIRHVSTQPAVSPQESATDAEQRQLNNAMDSLLRDNKPQQSRLSKFSIAPGSLKHEFAAEVSQVLFTDTQEASRAQISNPMNHGEAKFLPVLQQALLPQLLLTGKKVQEREEHRPVKGTSSARPNPLLLRLRLRPVEHSHNHPPLEIIVRGEDEKLGLSQSLTIRKASAIIDDRQHCLLLPNLPADIVLMRQTTIDLFAETQQKSGLAYLKLLRQVASHLEQTKGSDQADMSPVWRLDVSCLVKDGVPPQPKVTEDLVHSGNNASATPETRIDAPKSTLQMKHAAYILEPPEYLDVHPHTSTMDDDCRIEHIACDTRCLNQPRQRQLLRVSATPLSNLLRDEVTAIVSESKNMSKQHQLFKKSALIAYNLVLKFHGITRTWL